VFRLYDRHVARRFGTEYLMLVGALIVFFVVLHYVEFVDDFMDRGATAREVFTVYYPNYVPEIVRLISPLALFLACIHLTGRLAQRMEIAALQTSGVPLARLMVPYLAIAVVVTGFMFWFNGWVVPETNRVRIAFEMEYTKDAPELTEYNKIHRQTGPGSVLSVGFFDRTDQTARTVTMERFDGTDRLVERIDAARMRWIDSLSVWRVYAPIQRSFSPDGSETLVQRTPFDTVLTLLPRDMARTDGDVDAMTITEASHYIESLERAGADNLGLPLVTYYGKFAYPFANVILVLLGVPLAAVRRRGGQGLVLGLGLLLAFVYLALQKLLEPFGFSGLLPPLLAAVAPHVVFLGVAVVALLRARR
jgi:lipopolysaccharide export system permease protein